MFSACVSLYLCWLNGFNMLQYCTDLNSQFVHLNCLYFGVRECVCVCPACFPLTTDGCYFFLMRCTIHSKPWYNLQWWMDGGPHKRVLVSITMGNGGMRADTHTLRRWAHSKPVCATGASWWRSGPVGGRSQRPSLSPWGPVSNTGIPQTN